MTVKKQITINLVMQPLKVVVVVKDLGVLIHPLSLTFLKIFLEILQMELEGQVEDLRVVGVTT